MGRENTLNWYKFSIAARALVGRSGLLFTFLCCLIQEELSACLAFKRFITEASNRPRSNRLAALEILSHSPPIYIYIYIYICLVYSYHPLSVPRSERGYKTQLMSFPGRGSCRIVAYT